MMALAAILVVLPAVAETAVAETAANVPAAETPAPAEFVALVAADVDLAAFLWTNRPIVVFADSAADPAFAEQMRHFAALWSEMAARDVVVITDTDPAAFSALREKLRPRGFMLVLIDKTGAVVLRKPFPWDVRELSRAIDKLPLRQEEIRAKRFSTP